MNGIRKINDINQKELAQNVSENGSWHYDYRDTSYIFIGNLSTDLVETDIITIFSQWGVPTHINLVKDKETGKSRGFCYLKYQNYRSCILAVDNFNGIKIYGRNIKVDHVYFKIRENQKEDDFLIDYSKAVEERNQEKSQLEYKEPKLLEYDKQEDEARDPMDDFNDEFADPMQSFIKDQKPKRRDREKRRKRSSDKERQRSSKRDETEQFRDRSPKRDETKQFRDRSPTRDETKQFRDQTTKIDETKQFRDQTSEIDETESLRNPN